MKTLRAAVVGVGHLGRFHAQKYAALADTRLAAVVDADPDRARAVAAETGAEPLTDHRELAGRVDLASVAVPTSGHFAVVRDLLIAGIHVLVEKPITVTTDEARQLIELARSRNLRLQVGHLERFNPVMGLLATRLERPLFIESSRVAPFKPRAMDVDVVLDLMIHDIDLILNLVKSPLTRIDASGSPVITPGIDIANARLQFANGCVANVTASRISLKQERRMRLFQDDAYFSADLAGGTLEVRRKADGGREMFPGVPAIESEHLQPEPGDALEAEIRAFVASVRDGLPCAVTGEDGLQALEAATAVIAQVREGQTSRDQNKPLSARRHHG